MQTMKRILRTDGGVGSWTDQWGSGNSTPEVIVGQRLRLRFDLRQTRTDDENGYLLPVDFSEIECDSYYIAFDGDWDHSTTPRLLKVEGITVVEDADGYVFLEAEIPNTAVAGIMAVLEKKEKFALTGEIGGFRGDDVTAASFTYQFPVTVRNRIWLGGEAPEYVQGDPEYLTSAQVRAIIAEYFRPEKGDKGDPGLSAYGVAVEGGYIGTASEWLESLKGAKGDPGASAYQIAVVGGYKGTEAEWIASLQGVNGKNAYELAVQQGFVGSLDIWLESLKGETGKDMRFDATGELTELDAYAYEQAGFTFASTVTNPTAKNTKLYIFVKRSAEVNDWYPPLVITYYGIDGTNGKDGENIALLPPLEFTAPKDDDAQYLYFDLTKYPAASVASVCIDTAEGEYRLPYNSALGVTKILKNALGTMFIYFGSLVPEFETGRVYFAQGSAGLTQYQWYQAGGGTMSFEDWVASAMFLDAPADGKKYARQNGAWVEIICTCDGGGATDPEPEPDYGDLRYGYIPYSVSGTAFVSAITAAMLNNNASAITTVPAAAMGKTSLGVIPAGALAVVLIPTAANLKALKFDGISGWTAFSENNGATGTGSNGDEVMLSGVSYQVYGEFKLSDAELFFSVTEGV